MNYASSFDPINGLSPELSLLLKKNASILLRDCKNEHEYKLTKNSDISAFSNCFGILLSNFIGEPIKPNEIPLIASSIYNSLLDYRKQRKLKCKNISTDKYYLQLLAFTLSCFYVLDVQDQYPLDELIEELIPNDMSKYLDKVRSKDGLPQSGNLAMCMGVISIYANNYLKLDTKSIVKDWVIYHLDNMNKFGFWGNNKISHLQFQNAYHQYEIFEYLNVDLELINKSVEFLHEISDDRGQFAPYYGGSGCYDYDAISIITYLNRPIDEKDRFLMHKTINTILNDMNEDGCFSESCWIRPRHYKKLAKNFKKCFTKHHSLNMERARYFISLQMPKNNYVHTHWTNYSRNWSESNLWDTWFRLQTIAKIDIAVSGKNHNNWNFIDFPGIGFHHLHAKN